MSDSISGSFRQLHQSAGVAAGGVSDGSRVIPVVTVTFCVDESALVDLDNDIYDPDDGRWANYSMPIHAARQLIGDLNDMIDQALAGIQDEGTKP